MAQLRRKHKRFIRFEWICPVCGVITPEVIEATGLWDTTCRNRHEIALRIDIENHTVVDAVHVGDEK